MSGLGRKVGFIVKDHVRQTSGIIDIYESEAVGTDDVGAKLAQFSVAPTIHLILKREGMVDAVGIEPTTSRLRVECSTS